MARRQKILIILLAVAVGGWWGLPFLRAMVFGRLDEDSRRLQNLKASAALLEDKEFTVDVNKRKLRDWRDRSLPPEPAEAQRLYQEWVNDLAELAGISALRVTPEPMQVTPNAPYRAVRVSVKGEGTFDQLTYFLHQFHRTDLLHRVQALKVEGPANPGGPLKILLTAEGLCLKDAAPRNHLFPRSELADSLPRSFDTVKLTSTEEFPKEPGFTVRIDNEVVKVTKIAGNNWTVERAAEGTSKAYHAAKVEVELFPVRFDQRNLKLEDRKKALAKHPFVQPTPPPAPVPTGSDPARQTKLMGIIDDGGRSAWLFNESTRLNTVIRKDTPISVGDIQGTVVAIEPTAVQIKRGEDVWELTIGKDLRSMTRAGAGNDDSANSGMPDEGPGASSDQPRGNPGGRSRGRSRRLRQPESMSEPQQ